MCNPGVTTFKIKVAEKGQSLDDDLRLRVQAGTEWDAVVSYAVDRGLGGIEALSGVPGSCGAAPIQNIGAYGTEVLSLLAYRTSIGRLEIGMGSAVSVILFLCVALMAVIAVKGFKVDLADRGGSK